MFEIGDKVVVERASSSRYNGLTGSILKIVESRHEKPIAVIKVESGNTHITFSKKVRFYTWKLKLLERKGHVWEV